MTGLSERVQQRLRALTAQFSQQLPDRMRIIAESARRVFDESPTEDTLWSLRNDVHKLAGSAATFGFHHLSATAKRVEHTIDELVQGEASSEDLQELRMLLSDLDVTARGQDCGLASNGSVARSGDDDLEMLEAEEDVAPETPASPLSGVNVGSRASVVRRAVAIAVDGTLAGDLEAQLDFFGFEHRRISEIAEVRGLVSACTQTALVIDAHAITGDPAIADELSRLKHEHETGFHVACVSDNDDFETRLRAIRSGGEAFFTSPVDVARLVDKLDSLTEIEKDQPHHVLIVDDDVEQVSYTALVLQQAGMITSVASDPRNVFAVLIESKPELILMDMYMPGCSGLELATLIRQQEAFVGIPIVFLSVETDVEKQIKAIDHGGDEFITKPIKPEHLIATVTLRIDRTRSMRYFMERDSLTGLLNHTHLKQHLSKEVQRAERIAKPVSFVMIDIDHFKQVNDTYGHLTGDRVLKSLARFLTDKLRKTDTVGRYGGEEFGVVLLNVDAETALRVMDKIRAGFAELAHTAGDETFSVTFSCGIAAFPTFDGPGPLGEAADRALYCAKESGRNRVVVAEPLRTGTDQQDRR